MLLLLSRPHTLCSLVHLRVQTTLVSSFNRWHLISDRAQQEHVPIRNLSPEIRALEQHLMLLEQAEIQLSQTIQQLKEEMVIHRKGSSAVCHLLVLNLKSQYQGIELLNVIAKHIGVDASKIMPNPIGQLCEGDILQLIGLSDQSKPSTQPSQTHQEPFPEVE